MAFRRDYPAVFFDLIRAALIGEVLAAARAGIVGAVARFRSGRRDGFVQDGRVRQVQSENQALPHPVDGRASLF